MMDEYVFHSCFFVPLQRISAGAGAVYLLSRIAYALGYYTGGELSILSNMFLLEFFLSVLV